MKAICDFQKVRCFTNTDVNEKVYSFNKTKRKHTYSPISYKRIICNNRDPSWINKNIKKKQINNKNPAYKFYCHSKNNSRVFQNFQFLQSKLSFLMKKHTHKIMLFFVTDPATSPKSHWSPRGMIYLNNIRIPRISLLLHHKTISSYKYLQ